MPQRVPSFASTRPLAVALALGFAPGATAAKTEVPLFLFSGQSNMVGLGASTSGLGAAQRQTFPDIKIYLDAEGDAAKMKKWSTLGPGFGGNANQFGPELFFGKVMTDSFPGKKLAFIKVARSGTYLGKNTEWMPPSSNGGTGGPYYTAMMGSIDAALKAFNSAFDTAQHAPRWAGFLWLQGEFDAMDAALANQYETNLTNLIKDIRQKAGVADLPVILPMIDPQAIWSQNAQVRAADIAVAQKLENVDTLDTKGLPTDGVHYLAAGMITIGESCAARWLAMDYLRDVSDPADPVSVRGRVSRRATIGKGVFPWTWLRGAAIDLTGRKARQAIPGTILAPSGDIAPSPH